MLEPGKKEVFMGYNLQWWSEPESKLSMFSVESGYPKTDQERINQQLLGRLWSEVISYHDCLLRGAENAEFDQGIGPKFLSPDILSLSITTSYDCGDAHPDFGDSPINLNVHTGRNLSLDDVLWVGEGAPPAPGKDARESNQREVLVPWLIKQLTTLYPAEMKKPAEGDEDSCDYTDESVWGYSNWYFTATGLYLGPYFARVQRNCDDPGWSVLPYSVVKQHPGTVKLQLP